MVVSSGLCRLFDSRCTISITACYQPRLVEFDRIDHCPMTAVALWYATNGIMILIHNRAQEPNYFLSFITSQRTLQGISGVATNLMSD